MPARGKREEPGAWPLPARVGRRRQGVVLPAHGKRESQGRGPCQLAGAGGGRAWPCQLTESARARSVAPASSRRAQGGKAWPCQLGGRREERGRGPLPAFGDRKEAGAWPCRARGGRKGAAPPGTRGKGSAPRPPGARQPPKAGNSRMRLSSPTAVPDKSDIGREFAAHREPRPTMRCVRARHAHGESGQRCDAPARRRPSPSPARDVRPPAAARARPEMRCARPPPPEPGRRCDAPPSPPECDAPVARARRNAQRPPQRRKGRPRCGRSEHPRAEGGRRSVPNPRDAGVSRPRTGPGSSSGRLATPASGPPGPRPGAGPLCGCRSADGRAPRSRPGGWSGSP